MGRKTTSVTEAAFERCDEHRRDDESWTDFFHRVADLLEDGTEQNPQTVAVENVAEVARATADEVENRMTRR